jgi:hypothetical protein
MRGVITGGWSFVVAAYTVTTTLLAVYAVTLFARLRKERTIQ